MWHFAVPPIPSQAVIPCEVAKKIPLYKQPNVFLVETEVDKIVTVFILSGTAIRKVVNFGNVWKLCFQALQKNFLKGVHSAGCVPSAVTNHAVAF